MRYRGLTWDHPRGYRALEAAGDLIAWDRQPLSGFEEHAIADLAARYDLVVIDHPHIGEAVAGGCFRPLEELFDADEIADWGRDSIGPSMASYRYAGRHWALPLDAAAQVMAYRADLTEPADSWDDVVALSARVPVALSLVGPHAALSFQSVVAGFDVAPAADRFVDDRAGAAALDILATLHGRAVPAALPLNPIALLERMAAQDDVAFCPLVFGYVNYAAPVGGAHPVLFRDAPRVRPEGRPGSTIGGTGIAVSTRAAVTPELIDHLRWLLGEKGQMRFIPAHDGQPSRRAAWIDDDVNLRWNGFFRDTVATLEQSHVRPRHAGAIPFQARVSAMLRDGLATRRAHRAILDNLQAAFVDSFAPGTER